MSELNNIFIGGLPRSGTTLVQNLLDAHSKVYGGPEFDRIPNIIDLRNKLQASLKAGRISEYTTKKEIDSEIRRLILTLITPLKLEQSITHISEKTPWNILFFEELLEVFPESKFVMVIRNPMDVLNSMRRVAINAKNQEVIPPDFTLNYKIAIAYMEAVYKIMENLSKSYSNRIILVRYESFLTDFEMEAKRLVNFLCLQWEVQMLEFYKMKHSGEETMTQNNVWYTKNQFNANPQEVTRTSKQNILKYYERAFLVYIFRKNTYVNSNYIYFNEPTISQKLIGRLIFWNYKKKYRFKSLPKRVLK